MVIAANTAIAGTRQLIPRHFRVASHLTPSPSARLTPIEGRYRYLSWMTNSGSNLLIAASAGANHTTNQTAHRINSRERVRIIAAPMHTTAPRQAQNAIDPKDPTRAT